MNSRSTLIFDSLQPAVGSNILITIPWLGGRGWFIVAGTFSGASAKLNFEAQTNFGGSGAISAMLPDLPNGINAPGVFPFEAPEGRIVITSPIIAGGDSLIATCSVADVNP